MPIQIYCWRVMELNSVQNRTSLCKIDYAINILGKIDGFISFYYFQWLHLPKAITSEHASCQEQNEKPFWPGNSIHTEMEYETGPGCFGSSTTIRQTCYD